MKTYKLKSLGLTGQEWLERLEKKKYNIGYYTKDILLSKDWKPLEKDVEQEIAIITISNTQTTNEIKNMAKELKYEMPHPEIACLIRENISDKEIQEMGLWYIVTMHEPIKDSVGVPHLLDSDRDDGGRWLYAGCRRPDGRWDGSGGFAFAVPQVSPKNSETLSSSTLSLDLEKRIEKIENWIKKEANFINPFD